MDPKMDEYRTMLQIPQLDKGYIVEFTELILIDYLKLLVYF